MKYILIILFSIGLIIGVLSINTFQLFDGSPIEIASINIPQRDYSIKVLYIESNATTESSIQIKCISKDSSLCLGVYEGYCCYNGFKKINNDSIEINISDTSSVLPRYKKIKLRLK